MARGDYPPIVEPSVNLESHQEAITAIKQSVDILTRQRKSEEIPLSAVTWNDLLGLGLVTRDQLPRR